MVLIEHLVAQSNSLFLCHSWNKVWNLSTSGPLGLNAAILATIKNCWISCGWWSLHVSVGPLPVFIYSSRLCMSILYQYLLLFLLLLLACWAARLAWCCCFFSLAAFLWAFRSSLREMLLEPLGLTMMSYVPLLLGWPRFSLCSTPPQLHSTHHRARCGMRRNLTKGVQRALIGLTRAGI